MRHGLYLFQGVRNLKMLIKEFAELTGVTVRTLRYYDKIGLLKPSFIDQNNGYRFYDEKSLERMQEILFYRELDFSLKSISEILSYQNYNKQDIIKEQKYLLTLKKQRLEKIISALEAIEQKGEIQMDIFDNTQFENAKNDFEDEVKKRWGNTSAYNEYKSKSKDITNNVYEDFDSIFGEFADSMKESFSPSDDDVQSLVKKLQNFITENFYTCTNEILSGLGQMYVCDERFKSNIDKHGKGTAEFVSSAIKIFCKT